MKIIKIKELQKNPSSLIRYLEYNEYVLITKKNKPIGIAISFNDKIITNALKTSILIEAYENSLISLGELAKALNMSKEEVLKFLSTLGIDVINHDFNEDLETIKEFLGDLNPLESFKNVNSIEYVDNIRN